jgi:drug/metabolite transporter (DMT)-like permease
MLYALILVAGVIAVGSAALMARLGLGAGLTPLELSAWRMTMAALILGGWLLARRAPQKKLSRDQALALIGSGSCIGIHFAIWFTSLEYVHVARSTLVVSTTPIWAGLLGLVIPSLRPPGRFWLGLVIALAGMVLVTVMDHPLEHLKEPDWVGDVLAGIGAIIFVPYLLLSQRVQKEVGMEQAILWIYSSAAVCLWILGFASGQVSIPTAPAAWMSILGMAVIAQLGGHTVFNWALRHFSAGQVGSALLLEPVFAAVLAWMILGERLEPLQEIGGVLLLIGVAITLTKKKTQLAKEATAT